jgi:tetratricopeptide (TPR) repeat protein
VKLLFPLLAASILILPLKARAVECDSHSDGSGGYEKTMTACGTYSKDNQSACVSRLIPVLVKCQHKLDDCGDNAKCAGDVQGRIDDLKKFAQDNDGILQASLQRYSDQTKKLDPALAKLGFQQPKPQGNGTSDAESPLAPPVDKTFKGKGSSANGRTAGQGNPSTADAAKDFRSGDAQSAEQKLNQVLQQNPNDVQALMLRAEVRAALGNREGQVSDARRALRLDPSNKMAKQMVDQAAHLEQADGIRKKFGKLADGMMRSPQDDGSAGGKTAGMPQLGGKAGAGLDAGSGTTAGLRTPSDVARAGSSSGRSPGAFAPLVLSAIGKMQVGDLTGALLDATRATDADPNDAAAWTVRAEIDNRLENYASGIEDAGRAIALAPGNARALRARSFAELESGQFKQALADAARATALDPANGLGYLYKAMAEERLGMNDDAVRDLRRAVALDSSLAPLAAPLFKKLGLSAPAPSPSGLSTHFVRGGLIVFSLGLVLYGLLGTRKGRELTRRFTPRPESDFAADAAPPPADLAPGALLGGTYRIVREIGRGGMGVVYEGLDETLQRRVAVKRLLQDSQTTREDLDRFLREARLVAQMKHANVAEIYTVLPGPEPLLIFEFVDGKSLDAVLREKRALTLPAARKVVGEVASALASAHARGIIHRDLKPSNVMIAADGTAKVMDFGIAHQARVAATNLTRTLACGTPPYMAPEQGMGSVSKASDIYALGVMAYELVTGARPFDGPDYLEQKLQRRYVPASQRSPAANAALDALFAQVFDPDPTRRPADAAAFAEAFERACNATPRRQPSSV